MSHKSPAANIADIPSFFFNGSCSCEIQRRGRKAVAKLEITLKIADSISNT